MSGAGSGRASPWIAALLAAIVLVAAGARFLGAAAGLPYLHHWDEPQIASTALHMMQTGDLNPHDFHYGSMTTYLCLIVDVLHYFHLMGQPAGSAGSPESPGDIKTKFDTGWHWSISHPSFYLWNRRLVALFGAASVALCGLLAWRLGGRWAGILAAALLAGNRFHLLESSTVNPDLPASFLVLWAALLSVLYLESGRASHLVGSLAACGLAASSKYNAVVSIVIPLLALAIASVGRRPGHRGWLWAALPLVPAAAFLAGTPYALFDLPEFVSDAGAEIRHYTVTGHEGYDVRPGTAHLALDLRETARNLGWPAALLAAAGLPFLLRRPVGWVCLIFPGAFLLLMSGTRVALHRNLTSIYPFAAVAFGCGAVALVDLARRRLSGRPAAARAAAWIVAASSAGICAWGLAASLREGYRAWSVPESRTLAVRRVNALVEARGPAGIHVGVEEELRVHPSDLASLGAEHSVHPYLRLICAAPDEFDLLVVAKRHEAFFEQAAEKARRLSRSLPEGMRVLQEIGGGRSLMLDVYTVNPGVLILDPTGRPDLITSACHGPIPARRLFKSHDFPVLSDGTIVMYWNGTVSTPAVAVTAGEYEFSWRARGTSVRGRPAVLRAAVLGAGGGGAPGLPAERTIALTDEPAPYSIRFRVERDAEVLLRLDFLNDDYAPERREDRNIFLETVAFGEAGPAAPRGGGPT